MKTSYIEKQFPSGLPSVGQNLFVVVVGAALVVAIVVVAAAGFWLRGQDPSGQPRGSCVKSKKLKIFGYLGESISILLDRARNVLSVFLIAYVI